MGVRKSSWGRIKLGFLPGKFWKCFILILGKGYFILCCAFVVSMFFFFSGFMAFVELYHFFEVIFVVSWVRFPFRLCWHYCEWVVVVVLFMFFIKPCIWIWPFFIEMVSVFCFVVLAHSIIFDFLLTFEYLLPVSWLFDLGICKSGPSQGINYDLLDYICLLLSCLFFFHLPCHLVKLS